MPKSPARPCRVAVLALAVLITAAFAPAASAQARRISLRVGNGWSLVGPTEFNDYLADFSRSYNDISGVGLSHITTFPIRWAQDFEIGLEIPLRSGLAVTASAGLLGASSEGDGFDVNWGTSVDMVRHDNRVRSIFARLSLLAYIRLAERIDLRPHLGLDVYWSSFDAEGSENTDYSTGAVVEVQSWSANTHAFNLGWTAGLELAWSVLDRLALTLDAGWRAARLSGFSGRYNMSWYGVPEDAVDFSLLYFEEKADWIPANYKRFNLPGGWSTGDITAAHDAVIDLSGAYLKAGLRVSF